MPSYAALRTSETEIPSSAPRIGASLRRRNDPLLGEHDEMRVVNAHQRSEEQRFGVLEVGIENARDVFRREPHPLLLSQAEQIGQQPVRAIGAGGQLAPQTRGRYRSSGPCHTALRRALRFLARGSTGTDPSIARGRRSADHARRESTSRAPAPSRAHDSSPIWFGTLNTGCFGTSTSIGAFSSVTRSWPFFTGYGPYCAWLNSSLL